MLEELWLDSCWNKYTEEDEDAEDKEASFAAWLRGEHTGFGDSDEEREDDEEEEEEKEEESGSEFSDDEETTIDASTMEESSGEEVDFENQRYKVPKSADRHRDEFQLDGWAARSTQMDDMMNDESADAVLRFCFEMVTEDFEDGKSSSTLLVYFSAVRGLSKEEGNEYLRPARYTPILSRLIYCTRLVFLEAILPRRAHPYAGFAARSRYGQLAALNT
ncbi:hypothetical protein IL306_014834, partial [Fusarium sp. DS 682]